MCKALDEIRAESKAEGVTQGKTDTIIGLITDGIITLSQGASQLNVSEVKLKEMIDARQ